MKEGGADGPDSPGPGGEKVPGTTRKCANCGQVGHIKTNKKCVCPSPLCDSFDDEELWEEIEEEEKEEEEEVVEQPKAKPKKKRKPWNRPTARKERELDTQRSKLLTDASQW